MKFTCLLCQFVYYANNDDDLDNHTTLIYTECIVHIIWGCVVALPVLYQPYMTALHSNKIHITS